MSAQDTVRGLLDFLTWENRPTQFTIRSRPSRLHHISIVVNVQINVGKEEECQELTDTSTPLHLVPGT